mgnify:CR=1 FL=1|jgi:hypothetical protein
MASTTFSGPVTSTNGFIGNVTGNVTGTSTGMAVLPAYTTTTLPTVVVGGLIYVSNANTNAGTVCFGKGSSWIDIKTGVAVVA